ncbi:MAG: hypothetical protein PGN37_27250 [Mycobacterium kyogaense]
MASLDALGVDGIVLAGNAGVGKSRVAREAARRAADAGWSLRMIAATATSRAVPLGAFAQWTDDHGGAPAALVRRVGEAIVRDAEPGRVLLLVDDAHLLDELSVLVVQHLVDSGTAKAVVTIRAGEPIPAALSVLWKDGRLVWRELGALSRELLSAVLEKAFGAVPERRCLRRLWDLTEGNMLFVRQLAEQEAEAGRLMVTDGWLRWHGDVAIGGSLAELVDTQVGALPEPVLEVIDMVAISEPIGWRCLATLAQHDAVEEAERRGLIRVSGDDVFVGHPLFAEIRRARCGSMRLRRLRGEVAAAMEDNGSAASVVKQGLLWLESDLPARPDLLLSAARAANSLLDFDLAERLFAAAADAGVGGARARVACVVAVHDGRRRLLRPRAREDCLCAGRRRTRFSQRCGATRIECVVGQR